jgi:hypothetical protein
VELSDLFIWGRDILSTAVSSKTKAITAQIGSAVNQVTESARSLWVQHVGFVSRPSNPVPGQQACQAYAIRGSSHDVVIASTDERGRALAGTIGPGETCIYAAGANGTSQGRLLIKGDGSVNLVTTSTNTSSGDTCGIFVSPDGIKLLTQWGYIEIGQAGIVLSTNGNQLTYPVAPGGSMISINNLPLVLSNVQVATGTFQAYSDTVHLGKLSTPATPVHYGPVPVASINSNSVFTAP